MAHKNVDYKPEDIQFPNQKIVQSELVHEMQSSYIEYAMSVIVGRALPDSAYKKKVVSALEGGGVKACAVVTGERLMSVFVPREDAERALRLAHSALIG